MARLKTIKLRLARSRLWRKFLRAFGRGSSMEILLRDASNVPDLDSTLHFDAAYYLMQYPDVAEAGVDPLTHYIQHGRSEGRLSSLLEYQRRQAEASNGYKLLDLCNPYSAEPGPRAVDQAFLITAITPTFNIEPRYIVELYQTLSNQTYSNWEWVVVDDGSSYTSAIPVLYGIAANDRRVRFICSPINLGISGASNVALASASGSFVALVDHDDLISRHAFWEIYQAWKSAPDTDIFFTDECKLQTDDSLFDFWAKPDWSPAYLECTMSLGHLAVYRRTFLDQRAGFRSEFDGTQDYDLALRSLLHRPRTVHVPIFAYLWRAIPGSAASSNSGKRYAIERQRAALLEYAQYNNPGATISPGHSEGYWRIEYPLQSPPPLLSYVIPAGAGTRIIRGGLVDLAINCVSSFEQQAFYPSREYIVVHNGNLSPVQVASLESIKGVRLVVHKDPVFNFSRTINAGVAAARGEFVCLLNDDVEAITPGGGELLVRYLAANDSVGAIGPKCLFEDGLIQQSGVVLLDAVGPAHAGTGMQRDFGGHHSHLLCRREAFCIGAAMLVARKRVFEEVGGFREDLPLNYNDVDFSIRVRDRGYTCVIDPAVEVFHFESATKSGTAMVEEERLFLKRAEIKDPYYSKWFDPSRANFKLKLQGERNRLPFGAWLDRHIARRSEALEQSIAVKVGVFLWVKDQPISVVDQAMRSATMQTHADTKILVVDGGIRNPDAVEWFQKLKARGVPTATPSEFGQFGSIAATLMEWLSDVDFVVFLSGADFLSVDALKIIASYVKEFPSDNVFYSDNYEADEGSNRLNPFFKPDFDPILLLNKWYLANTSVFSKEMVICACKNAGSEPISTIDRYLAVTAILQGETPIHIREPIYAGRVKPVYTWYQEGQSDAHRRAVSRLIASSGAADELTLAPQPSDIENLLSVQSRTSVANVRILDAEDVWGSRGAGISILRKEAENKPIDWVAILLSPQTDASCSLFELSAPALYDRRVNAVSGLQLEGPDRVLWAGGFFLSDGRVFDPYAGLTLAGGGYKSLLTCQRCVDVAAPVDVLIQGAALIRVIDRFEPVDADGLMVALGLDAHERGEFVCVTPQLKGAWTKLTLPPVDRRGIALNHPSLRSGSRWYDTRLEVERPYRMPGCQ